jgi:hypothetical protein
MYALASVRLVVLTATTIPIKFAWFHKQNDETQNGIESSRLLNNLVGIARNFHVKETPPEPQLSSIIGPTYPNRKEPAVHAAC